MPPALVAAPDAYVGQIIAERYKIVRKLGEGGMGVVYLAHHVVLEKPVAVKILAEDLARRADLTQRFLHEAKAASRIHHENVVDITDFGQTASGTVFFVMELLEGRDLAALIRREVGPIPWPRAKPILVQICRALTAAHEKGIIHRDMKPENVYLIEREGSHDFVKVLDFGVAKIVGLDESSGARLTRTGMIFGTPEYMSPEQAQGSHPDHRVDVYAVGVIMYEMLTGQVPFRADTFMGVLSKHMFEAPVPPSQVKPELAIAPELEAIVMRALEKDRARRFQTMAELGQAIASAAGGAMMTFGPQVGAVVTPASYGESGPYAGTRPSAEPLASPPLTVPRSRTGLVVILAATLAILAGGGFAAYRFLLAPAALAPAAADAASPAAPPAPSPAPKPAPVPRRVEVGLRSNPPGADVLQGDRMLGTTPARLVLPFDRKDIELVVRMRGYEDYTVRVVPDRNREFDFVLTQLPAKRRGPKHHGPRPQPRRQPEKTPKIPDLKDPFADG